MQKPKKRFCGSCTACCRTHAVLEINKSAGKWCPHCCNGKKKGCAIYARRPKGCRDFRCYWLKGYEDKKDRPERTKVILDICTGVALEDTLMLWEVSEGSLDSDYAVEARDTSLGNHIPVCCMYLDGRRKMFVPDTIRLSQEILEQMKEEKITLSIVQIQHNLP